MSSTVSVLEWSRDTWPKSTGAYDWKINSTRSQMSTRITLEILLIFLLVLANGTFAMAEIAIVSSRKARLRAHSQKGDR